MLSTLGSNPSQLNFKYLNYGNFFFSLLFYYIRMCSFQMKIFDWVGLRKYCLVNGDWWTFYSICFDVVLLTSIFHKLNQFELIINGIVNSHKKLVSFTTYIPVSSDEQKVRPMTLSVLILILHIECWSWSDQSTADVDLGFVLLIHSGFCFWFCLIIASLVLKKMI